MVVRSGRLLPSVIVGALVTGALALGAGVAGAAETCTSSDGEKFELSGSLERGSDGQCQGPGLLGPLAATLRTLGYSVAETGQTVEEAIPPTTPATTTPATTTAAAPSSSPGGGSSTASQDEERQGVADQRAREQQARAQQAAAMAARPAPQVPAASGAGLLTPAVSAPGGLAARVPALGFGSVDPRLLTVPTGSPLRTLTGVTPGSPVTTSSDVQAMALDGLPSGLGTPAVLGVLILSTLAGFALRHRVLRRVRLAAAPKSEPAT